MKLADFYALTCITKSTIFSISVPPISLVLTLFGSKYPTARYDEISISHSTFRPPITRSMKTPHFIIWHGRGEAVFNAVGGALAQGIVAKVFFGATLI